MIKEIFLYLRLWLFFVLLVCFIFLGNFCILLCRDIGDFRLEVYNLLLKYIIYNLIIVNIRCLYFLIIFR